MRNRRYVRGTLLRGLPALALAGAVLGLAFSSTALAEDPIVGVGPLGAGGTTASASAHDDPAASVCVGDDQIDAGLSGSSLIVPTEAVCAASAGGSTSVSNSSGSGGSGASSGAGASGAGAAAGAVSAADAVGLRIVRVRKDLKRVRATKSFRLFVTLKDRRGLLVRGATVSVGRVPGRTVTASAPRAAKSGKAGLRGSPSVSSARSSASECS